jgi:hypothetical protein
MEDVLLIATLVAAFALMIGLIRVISRMLERDTDRGELADEPPDTGTGYGNAGNVGSVITASRASSSGSS